MLDYQIALTNVNFDDTYNNVLLFDSRQIQEAYFKINTLFENAPKCNFKASTLLNTTLTYEADPNIDLANILMSNYAIVKQPNGKYLYYFVMNAFQVCDNLIRLDLELDVCQTFLTDLTFSDAVIKRYHINRFRETSQGSNNIVFNINKNNTDLVINEPIDRKAQHFIKNEILIPEYLSGLFNEDEKNKYKLFFENNILGWLYVYCVPNHEYVFKNILNQDLVKKINSVGYYQYIGDGSIMEGACSIFCVPVYRYTAKNQIYIKNGENKYLYSNEAMRYFLENNNGASYVYASKFTTRMPFKQFNALFDEGAGTFDAEGNLIINVNPINENEYFIDSLKNAFINTYGQNYIYNVRKEFLIPYKNEIELPYFQTTFTKDEIKQSVHDPKFNPKMMSQQVATLKLSTCNGSKKDYEIIKLLDSYGELSFQYINSEPLIPDITRTNLALSGSVFYTGAYNYDGLIDTFDNTLMLSQDQLALFMANNKNFMQQKTLERVGNVGKGVMGAVGNLSSGNYANAITGVGNTAVDLIQDIANTNYVLDNLENAPDTLKNANGSVVLNLVATDKNPYPKLELYQALPTDLQSFDDFTNQFGYAYGKLGNINNAMRVRKYFNYVQAEVQEVYSDKLNISNEVHNKIKQIFKNGVRLWNVESGDQVVTFDVNEHENYERWLDNEQ